MLTGAVMPKFSAVPLTEVKPGSRLGYFDASAKFKEIVVTSGPEIHPDDWQQDLLNEEPEDILGDVLTLDADYKAGDKLTMYQFNFDKQDGDSKTSETTAQFAEQNGKILGLFKLQIGENDENIEKLAKKAGLKFDIKA